MSGSGLAEGYPAILRSAPPSHGEVVPADEADAVEAIVGQITQRVREAALHAPARRDAHPKAHGCVRAIFTVRDDVPEKLRVGVFETPRTFDAWIRFSNGSGTPQPDRVGDGRGIAVKLLDVAGSPSGTQDFIMINAPAFFVRNAADYVAFQAAEPPWRFFFPGLNPFHFRLHELLKARAIAGQTVTNPLNLRYWSMTPILCGGRAAKFSARPLEPFSTFVSTASDDYLHANLAAHLAQGAAAFDFMVQVQGDPVAMPVEDPTVVWLEDSAPFVPVARITIEAQAFDSTAQRAFCENLSFTPWHSVAAHRPLGGINRTRRVVYETISRLRHELNGAPQQEPVHAAP